MTTNPTTAEAVRAAIIIDREADFGGSLTPSNAVNEIARIIDEQTALPELKADKERLDWLQKNGNRILGWKVDWTETGDTGLRVRQTIHESNGIREAIDAAMQSQLPPSVPALPGREEKAI